MSDDSILDAMREHAQSPEGHALELGLSFSELVLERLDELGWTQKRLAEKSGMKEAFISRLVHSDVNWTRDTAGRLLHALDIRARLHRHLPASWNLILRTDGTNSWQAQGNTTYDQDIKLTEEPPSKRICRLAPTANN